MKFSIQCLMTFSLSLSLALAAAADPQTEAAAARARMERLRPLLSVLRQALQQPGPVGDSLRRALKDRQEVLFNQADPITADYYKARLIVASLFKDKNTRDLLVSIANSSVERLSDDIKATAINLQEGAYLRVDELVVGTGPTSAAFLQEMTSRDPSRVVLAVDRAKRPGGTFADIGSAIALNSTNRQYTGRRARPGEGDLNNVHDIVGIPDFKGSRWAEAGSLGEVTSIGVYLSTALPMMETELVGVSPATNDDADGVVVTLEDLKTRTRFKVAAKRLVFASGLGTSEFPFTDEATLALIKREERSARAAGREPRIQAAIDVLNNAGDPENPNPIRQFVGEEIVVVGGGDTGRTINELLTGLAPEAAYKDDVAQVGGVKRIFWYVGFDSFEKCSEYIAKSRARYSRLAQAINSGVLIPVPGRVTAIGRDPSRKFTLSSEYTAPPARRGGKRRRETSEDGMISYVRAADPRKGLEEERVSERVLFDRVIVAAGIRDRLPGLVTQLTSTPFKDAWNFVERKLDSFGGETLAVARALKSNPNVLLAGPANESLGGLPKVDTGGINENTVSLFNNVERNKGLADELAEKFPAQKDPSIDPYVEVARLSLARGEVVLSKGSRVNVPVETSESDVSTDNIRRVSATDLALRTALDATLSQIRLEGSQKEFRVTLTREGTAYQIKLESPIKAAQAPLLSEAFRNNALLNSVLLRDYANYPVIDVVVPVLKSTGRLDLSRISVAPRRR